MSDLHTKKKKNLKEAINIKQLKYLKNVKTLFVSLFV